ncbi:small secreted protein [Colletotrichum sojae]|uniref:Small secreted protein n=1 Tax=Colletotrichum sojae TaxID=2175907 RepID=A0A8H6JXG7_9PEZI|nr:small secreted protein [Colletotrichum sojae]
MQPTHIVTALACFAGFSSAAKRKANEYKSGDCSGALNYGHHSDFLGDVTMDDSSNSVYLANTNVQSNWEFWDGKTRNGGSCGGVKLGLAPHMECNNLNDAYPGKRVRCVRFVD